MVMDKHGVDVMRVDGAYDNEWIHVWIQIMGVILGVNYDSMGAMDARMHGVITSPHRCH